MSVYYSHDNGNMWLPIDYDLEETGYSFDTTPLPGCSNCMVKVVATDNFNRGEAIFYSFSVPNKLPIVNISLPIQGSVFIQGDRVRFIGWADDTEDGELPESSLIWISNLDGEIGTGSSIDSRNLSLGEHQITLTAIDSEGEIATAITNISITTDTAPDLSVYNIEFRPEKPGVVNGTVEEVTIIARIFNIRSNASCDVTFQVDGVPFATEYIIAEANELTGVQAKWTPSEALMTSLLSFQIQTQKDQI